MANSILTSHYSGTSNTILVSHGWPSGSSANSVLASHDADYPATGDTQPAAFSFGADTTDNTLSEANITSAAATITGIDTTAPFNFTTNGGGSWRRYTSGAWGSWSSAGSGSVINNDQLQVRHNASASYSTAVSTTITFPSGPVSDTFTSTTLAASGTTLTDGASFTITGSGFGTRANAPAYTKSFDGLTTGLICTDPSIGLTSQGDTADGLYAYVSTVRSRKTGGKSLRLVHPAIAGPEVPDSFPQLGISGLSLTRVYVSTWFYWERISGTGGSGTFKLCRGGGDPPYGGVPRFHETYNGIDPTTGVATSYDPDRGASNTSNVTAYSNAVNASPSRDGWHRLEYYFYPGTEGNSDGIYKTWVDGVLNGNLVNIPLVLSGHGAAPVENVITPFDGMDSYSNDTAFACYIDDFHVDSTLRRLELGNASTWAACTVREFQPSTAWSDTSITALCQKGAIPTGTAYLFVIGDDGTASAGIEVDVA